MKKIIFLCHGAGNGGAERVITTLANQFYLRGYEVMLVTTKIEKQEYTLVKGVKRYTINAKGDNVLKRTTERIFLLRKCIKDYNPQCIISFSTVPNIQLLIAAIGLSTRTIISERTDPSRYPTSIYAKKIRNILYPRADLIVFQTNQAKSYFKKSISRNGVIIQNPIRDNLPTRFTGKREKKIVGIGSLGEQKHWMVALKACEYFFKEHPDYKMIIYGEGPERKMLQDYIEESSILKSKVDLAGFSENAVSNMNDAMMYISCSDYEGISNAMLEALATGVPTICTDCPVGGARQFIKNGTNGYLVPVNSPLELANAMSKLAEDHTIVEHFSKESVQIKKILKLESIVDSWVKEVERLC